MEWIKNHCSSVWHLNIGTDIAPCGKRIQGAGNQGKSKKFCNKCKKHLDSMRAFN